MRVDALAFPVVGRRACFGNDEVCPGIRVVPLLFNLDEQVARTALAPVEDETDELPVPARLDVASGDVIAEVPGRFLDLENAMDRIRDAARTEVNAFELRRLDIAPRVTRDYLQTIDQSSQLSRFSTWISRNGDQENRARNIDTAAARLDGVVLFPDEVFSFNQVVGPRTEANGFSKGWEIFKGEMVEGVGCGTCQAASTLHAAAYLAGLDVIERLPHSRPSAYITMGLDATAVYPVVDLKLRNPFDFPIVVHSHVEGGSVTFELLGREAVWCANSMESAVTRSSAPARSPSATEQPTGSRMSTSIRRQSRCFWSHLEPMPKR